MEMSSAGLMRKIFTRMKETYLEELNILITLAWPLVLSNILEQSTLSFPMMFSGHLGEKELGGVALGNTMNLSFGQTIVFGLNTACDTLFSQAYGQKNKKNLGVLVQKALVINVLMCFLVSSLIINSDYILLAIGQDPTVSRLAGEYSIFYVPGLMGTSVSWVLSKYLGCQGFVRPTFVILVVSNVVDVLCLYLLLTWIHLSATGVGMSVAFSYWSMAVMHILYIITTGIYKETWTGWSLDCLREWKTFFSLGISGLLMVGLPWYSYTLLTIFVGYLGTVELGAFVILLQQLLLLEMISYGLATATSIRVGNLLGEGDHVKAKSACCTMLFMTGFISSSIGFLFGVFGYLVSSLFTDQEDIKQRLVEIIPIATVYHVTRSFVNVECGVLLGTGQQKFGAIVVIIATFFITVPISGGLIFLTSIGSLGCIVGLILSNVIQNIVLMAKIRLIDWEQETVRARERTESHHCLENGYVSVDDDVSMETRWNVIGCQTLQSTLLHRLPIFALVLLTFVGGIVLKIGLYPFMCIEEQNTSAYINNTYQFSNNTSMCTDL